MSLTRAQLRAIAQASGLQAYNQAVKKLELPPARVRIGGRDPLTGKDEVLYPDGGKEIAGKRLFNSSVSTGSEVVAARASGDSVIMLDAKNFKPEPEQPEEPPKTGINPKTYILAYIDVSGSMDNEAPAIRKALETLKGLLKKQIYKSDENVKKYYQVKEDGSEQWLNWFGIDPRKTPEEEWRTVVLAFINESHPIYHEVPRNTALEPTQSFAADYSAFVDQYKKHRFFKGKIYSVKYPSNSAIEVAFSASARDAVNGVGNYGRLGKKLASYNCSYQFSLDAGTSADYYLQDIKKLLGIK